ncbi:MAG TPA: hypothetical protein VLF69_05340 [Candidatus Saccharimonadales bacterium]|nr:hypothetical protein [Candidatus Saccharimonadales bacterium]
MEQNISQPQTRYQDNLEAYWNLTQKKFYASEQGRNARQMLQELVESPEYDTNSTYFENNLPFRERHLDYMSKQPHLDITGYMSNLRLMTRKRG